ncbi:MAG: flagellar hook-basal body complex protein FliE [Bdellovibrionia bacterium]
MDGFTVKNANRFLETGAMRDSKSMIIEQPQSISPSSGGDNKTFAATLNDAISNVNQLHKVADKKAEMLATGKTDDIADVMIAAEKADIALRVMTQMRNKVIDAYQEIMKMQV